MTKALQHVVEETAGFPQIARTEQSSVAHTGARPVRFQIDALDGIRGLAVAMVFFSHLGNRGLDLFGSFTLAGIGKPGVFLFFVLSSFLLTRPLLKRSVQELQDPWLWIDYMVRRTLRIFPLFLAVLLISVVITTLSSYAGLSYGLPFTMNIQDVFAHLMMQDAQGVLWSIPVEFKFYFMLPVIVLVIALAGKNFLNSIVLLLAAAFLCITVWPAAHAATNTLDLWPYLPVFLIGSLAAVTHERIMLWAKRESRVVKIVFEISALLALLIIVATMPAVYRMLTGLDIEKNFFHKEFVFFGILWAVFILGTLHGSGYIRRLFSVNFLRYIGLVSFSVYLWHMTAIILVERFLGNSPVLIQIGVAALVTLSIATLSFRWIEKPFAHIRVRRTRNVKTIIPAASVVKAG